MRYAIVGTNWLCENYKAAIREAGDEVYAVLSRDEARGRAFAGEGPVVYTDSEALLADQNVEAVYVCLPNSLHHDFTIQALNAGKHVLCEKPFALTVEETAEMFAAADKAGKVLAEAVMSFYSPAMERIRSVIGGETPVSAHLDYSQRSSKLDRIRKGEMFSSFDRRLGGGALYDLGIYPLHFCVNLFGAPKAVTAKARWLGDVDVSDALILEYEGFDALITASKAGQSAAGSEILLDKGTLTFENVSVVLGAKYVTKAETVELPCGDAAIPKPGENPSNDSNVQTRVIRRFTAWTKGEDKEGLLALRENTRIVEWILQEARAQIGYTL